jgi:carbamoyltransferase
MDAAWPDGLGLICLGVSGGFHDSAAALLVDGQLVGAVQQERLSRIKHDRALPLEACAALLDQAGLSAEDVDAVFFHENPYAHLERVLVWSLRTFPRGVRQFPQAMRAQLGRDLWVLDNLASGLGVPRDRVHAGDHHGSHAASAFLCSPHERAAVLTLDGVGELHTTGMWLGEGDTLTCLGRLELPHSLGLLWAGVTGWMGLAVNRGEHEVMGLAAYGTPRFEDVFAGWVRCADDGSFEVDPAPLGWLVDPERGFGPEMEACLGPARAFNAKWSLQDPDFQLRADVAASLQQVTERVLLNLARALHERTGADALCLAGGVALNCRAVAHVAAHGPFEHVWVQPAAGDAGGALGAALAGAGVRVPLPDSALGVSADPERAWALCQALGLPVERVSDPAGVVGQALAQGRVVAWVQGRCEWGPRGLGQRALLADAARVQVAEALSKQVKPRAPFRPFAPVVQDVDFGAHFGGAPDGCTAFMTTLRAVRGDTTPATTHVDGTARVQSVSAESTLAPVLQAFSAAGGGRVLLNTSLNAPGDPAVAREADALAWALAHPTTPMMLHDLWIHP